MSRGRTEFDRVGKRFGPVTAVTDFSLRVEAGEFLTVLGPSGCGKSTLLRLTAGLETLTTGTIHLDGRRIDRLPARDRDVAMVFQSYALYPHMTVRQNIEFPLRMRGSPARARRQQVEAVAAMLELTDVLERLPRALSGGQRQRVALARALVRHPALFLLDEPLSNLDARLRMSVRGYIRDLQQRLGVTTLYVTHDQAEAMTLGDRMVVMQGGTIQQVGSPLEVYRRPANIFVATFVGTPPMNLLPAEFEGGVLRVAGRSLRLPSPWLSRLGATPRRLTVGVRPEAFDPRERVPGEALVVQIDPRARESLGSETLFRAQVEAHRLTVRLPGPVLDPPPAVAAPVEALHLFAEPGGQRLAP